MFATRNRREAPHHALRRGHIAIGKCSQIWLNRSQWVGLLAYFLSVTRRLPRCARQLELFNCLAMALEVEQHGCERHAWPPGAAIFTLFGAAGSASMVAAAVARRWHFLAALNGVLVLCAEHDAHDATAVP